MRHLRGREGRGPDRDRGQSGLRLCIGAAGLRTRRVNTAAPVIAAGTETRRANIQSWNFVRCPMVLGARNDLVLEFARQVAEVVAVARRTPRGAVCRGRVLTTSGLDAASAAFPPRPRVKLPWHRPTTGYCVVYAGRDGTGRLAAKNREP